MGWKNVREIVNLNRAYTKWYYSLRGGGRWNGRILWSAANPGRVCSVCAAI